MSSQNGHSSQVLHERIDSIASGLRSVADQLSTAASSARNRASDVTSHAVSSASSLGAKVSKLVQQHPLAAIGIAIGAGYLVLRVVRR